MRIATYIRVSTQEQAVEGYSIEAQKERLSNYCKAKGWQLVAEYIDGGFSGSNLDRPQIQKLINDVKSDIFDGILVYKLDRLSRSQKDTLYLIEDVFLKNEISFISLNENFDTSTAFGRAMIGILSVFAQLEREQIKERTRMGLEERVKQGKHHSFAPFGYRYVDKKLIIEPSEAEVVKFIFERVSKNYTFTQIKREIIENYPEFPVFGTSYANKVADIAHNITYGGYVKFGDVICKGDHPAIIGDKLYKQAHSIMDHRRNEWETNRTRKTGTKSTYLLSGFLFCGQCGARYRVMPRPKKTVYICYSRAEKSAYMAKKVGCTAPTYLMNDLDEIILNEIRNLGNENYFNSIIKQPKEDNGSVLIEKNKKEIDKISKQIGKMLDLYGLDGMDITVLSQKIKSLTDKKAALEKTVIELQGKVKHTKLKYEQVSSMLSCVDELIENGATNELRQLLQMLIDKIIITNDEIKIKWTFA